MSRRFEPHPDELLSASLSEQLPEAERHQLDAHLAGCERCQQLLAAFADQRRLLSGMRHVPAPSSLAADVEAGLAEPEVPWWRRPAPLLGALGAAGAVAAGALLAVMLTAGPEEPPVAASPDATPTADATPQPTATFTAAPTPAETPVPTPEPVLAAGEIGYLSLTGTPLDPMLELRRSELSGQDARVADLRAESGPPVAASISPDGQWLAYQTFQGGPGWNRAWLVRLADGHAIDLGETPGDPFGRQMAWFGASKSLLAYTRLSDPGRPTASTDVWVADTVTGETVNVTNNGAAYVGSFIPNTDLLYVSVSGSSPNSFLVDLTPTDAGVAPVDLATEDPIEGVFQPMLNARGDRVIFWRGVMGEGAEQRIFRTGGMLYVEEAPDGGFTWEGQQLFEDVLAGADAVTDAAVTWSPDGDAFAAWNVRYSGNRGTPEAEYPDPASVYVGRVSTGDLVSRDGMSYRHSNADEPAFLVVDVQFAPGESGSLGTLLLTVQLDAGSEGGDGPLATAILVRVDPTTGAEEPLGAVEGWAGPAVHVEGGDSDG